MTEGLAGQYVEIYHFADGQVDVRWKGLSLPYTVFDKEQRVSQAEVVENKRLGAALALVKTLQGMPRPSPRVKSASEAGGYVKTGRKSRRKSWRLGRDHPNGLCDGSAIGGRPQGRRLRRPAPRLWALTPASDGEGAASAVDGSVCRILEGRCAQHGRRTFLLWPTADISIWLQHLGIEGAAA